MKYLVLIILATFSSLSYAQLSEEIAFDEKQFDFGTVKEEDGPIIHEFKFINHSEKPIKITNVRASCGCTTPAWSKEEVKPGESGFIQAQYNPHNRPGRFNKSLTVTTDYDDQPIRLYIRGNVTPKPKTVEEELATNMNGLRVKYRSLNMGKVLTTDEPTVKSFDIYNDTDSAMTFLDKMEIPDYIEVAFKPEVLPAKTRGSLEISYYGKKKNDFGFSNDNLTFYSDQEGDVARKDVSIFATVLEYFPPMTKEELDKAPRLTIEEAVYDFGKVAKDGKVNTTFTLTNNGASTLSIRKVDPNCSCVETDIKKMSIKPGKSETLEVTFNAQGRRGNQQKSVTIYTNDPRNPVQRVTMKAYVEN